jgi:hypothetical protein
MKKVLLLCLAVVLAGCSPAASETPAPPPTEPSSATVTPEERAVETPNVSDITETEPSSTKTGLRSSLDQAELLNQLLFSISTREEGEAILTQIAESGDTRFVAGLIDALRYHRTLSREIGDTLNVLTGQNLPPDWFAWVEWAGQHPEIESFADYPAWKANLLAQIDPNFLRFVHADLKVAPDSRVEEIVWGGVRVDGIPALDNPTMVDPGEAVYLVPEERVFGVSINGDSRAYPARFLDWHEMFNDIVGGEPVSLAY